MNASVEYGRSQFQVRLHDKKKTMIDRNVTLTHKHLHVKSVPWYSENEVTHKSALLMPLLFSPSS